MDTPFFRSTSITPDWVSIVPKKVNIILTIGDLYSVRTGTSGYTNYTVDIVRGCIFNNFSAYFRNKGDNTWYSLFDGCTFAYLTKVFTNTVINNDSIVNGITYHS